MILIDLLYKVSIRAVKGNTNVEVRDLQIDSRKVAAGTCFIAIKGSTTDGHRYISTAIAQGAIAVICEALPADAAESVTWIQVENCAAAAG